MWIDKYIFSKQVKTKILKNLHSCSNGARVKACLWNNN